MNLAEYFDGLFGTFKSFGYISRNSLWKYCILPALISVVCAYFIYSFFAGYTSGIGIWLVDRYPFDWGSGAVESVGTFIGKAISFASSLILFKYLVLIISSPFMSLLSERVEEIEFGDVETKWTMASLIKDLVRGIRINVRNLFKELFYVLLLMILGLFPVIGLFTVAMTFLVQAYYAGFGSIDYLLERHLNLRESTYFVSQRKSYAAGIGTSFLLLSMTGIGLLFAAPLATVEATRTLAPEL